MGKKVDLNAPRNANKGIQNKSYRFHAASNPNNTPSKLNDLQKKIAVKVMASQGISENTAKQILENEKLMEVVGKIQKITGAGTPPIIVIPIIVAVIVIVLLMLFVLLFGNNGNASASGSLKYGPTCTTITVTNTGCNGNAEECSHIYDGEVTFEEYIAGVVAAEVSSVQNLEYYKTFAIAARTFFLGNSDSNCTVNGNASYQAYRSVDSLNNSKDIALIKQAVEETEGLVMVKNNKPSNGQYSAACVVSADDKFYHIRYGSESIGTANIQKIPREWDNLSTRTDPYKGNLAYWFGLKDPSSNDLQSCPFNHDYGMSQLGALYLITEEDYSFEETLRFYYGEDIEIVRNEMQLSGINGFVNPVRSIDCRSAYGMRLHPVYNEWRKHSGIDLGGLPAKEPIFAVKSGTITHVIKHLDIGSTGYGNYVIIDHGDGTSTVYAHMAYGTIPDSIYVGATVSQGEQIGGIGTTGTSTGNHLHYEVRVNNETVDPADYIDWTNGKDSKSCRK